MCTKGLGAVLLQKHSGVLHLVAYASSSLSSPERKYGISELESLTVIWAMHHFYAYLYGHLVKVITEHSAVKAVLQTPSQTGKHARWWSKVFSSGGAEVEIVSRPGKENARLMPACGHCLPFEVMTANMMLFRLLCTCRGTAGTLTAVGARATCVNPI